MGYQIGYYFDAWDANYQTLWTTGQRDTKFVWRHNFQQFFAKEENKENRDKQNDDCPTLVCRSVFLKQGVVTHKCVASFLLCRQIISIFYFDVKTHKFVTYM